jgi:hypothetical protein
VLTIVLKNFPLTTIKFLDHIKWFEPKPLAMESIFYSFLINPKSRTASNSARDSHLCLVHPCWMIFFSQFHFTLDTNPFKKSLSSCGRNFSAKNTADKISWILSSLFSTKRHEIEQDPFKSYNIFLLMLVEPLLLEKKSFGMFVLNLHSTSRH